MLFIVAMDADNCGIGKDNKLNWHIPEDLKFFKEKTIGKNIIMGRKTYEELRKNNIQLNNRNILVLSNKKGDNYYNLDEIIKFIKNVNTKIFDESGNKIENDIVICGGKEVYENLIFNPEIQPYLTHGYISKIKFKNNQPEYDVFLSEFIDKLKQNSSLKHDIESDLILVDNQNINVTIEQWKK